MHAEGANTPSGRTPEEGQDSLDSTRPLETVTPKLPARQVFLRQAELVERVALYDPTLNEALLNRAYVFTMKMHGSQLRASGDPYFAHPIEVAGILTEYRLDTATICSALLHDVVEDTDVTYDEIKERFGIEIAELVEGVTKLTKLELQSEYTKQSENLRKFMLAISKDIRVLLIKLADRLHNMRTLVFVGEDKRIRISRETLEVYAPLARSIGCNRFAVELEDLAFSFINPDARDAILQRLADMRTKREDAVERIIVDLEACLQEHGIIARVSGREKSAYSIWKKLQRKSLGFGQLSDIFAFRIVVDEDDACYRALGAIHQKWPCVQERFKDFISTPKSNNYQSLHTTVIGAKGSRIEMQIRTDEMDRIAEQGVAAHWGYKNSSYGFDEEAAVRGNRRNPLNRLRNIIQIVEAGGESEDWVEHAKMEMYADQVFCFTPKGRLISLPRGAMPLDFAFAVHTEVGETALGVMINGEHRPMHTVLNNGDMVDILRGLETHINSDWQSLTTTGRARSAIRRAIRLSQKEDFTKLGRNAIERAAAMIDRSLAEISWRPALERFDVDTQDALCELVGRSKIRPAKVLEALIPGLKLPAAFSTDNRVRIRDGEGASAFVRGSGLAADQKLSFCTVCRPLPGDRIIGIAEGEAVCVHSIECDRLEAHEAAQENWLNLGWTLHAEKNTVSMGRIYAEMRNIPGALGQACTVIGESKGNIVNISIAHNRQDYQRVTFDVDVVDTRHLSQISGALRTLEAVDTVDRVRG